MAEPTDTVLENVVVPVALLVWVRAPVILMVDENNRAAELVIVRSVSMRACPEPTAPVNVTAPVVFTVSVSAEPDAVPSVVPVTVTAPEPAARVGAAASPITRLPPIDRVVLVVVMLLDSVTAPVVENPPGATIAPVAPLVNIPEFVTAIAPVEVKLLFTE